MKLSDFLTDLGRPVAYYPELARALDDVKEAIFVCQMAYWKGKEQDPEGWIYKSSEEIFAETALSYKEQLNVRAGLRSKMLLEERYARTEHRMYFRIDWDAVNQTWEEHLTKGHMPKGKVVPDQREDGTLPKGGSPSDQPAPGSLPKGSSLNRNPEITPEITPESTREGEEISPSSIWTQVLEQVKRDAPRSAFISKIEPTRALRYDGNVLIVAAPDEDACAWLESRLTSTAEHLLIGILKQEVSVSFVLLQEVPA